MAVIGWGPISQPAPTPELQAAHAAARQQQQGDRRGALAGTKRTRAVAGAAQTFICLEDFEGSRKAEMRLRRAAEAAAEQLEGDGTGDAGAQASTTVEESGPPHLHATSSTEDDSYHRSRESGNSEAGGDDVSEAHT